MAPHLQGTTKCWTRLHRAYGITTRVHSQGAPDANGSRPLCLTPSYWALVSTHRHSFNRPCKPTTNGQAPNLPTPPTPRPFHAPSGPQVQSSLTAAHPALAAACEPAVKAHLTLAVMALCEGPAGLGVVGQGRRGRAGEGPDNEGSKGREGDGTEQQEPELAGREAGRGKDRAHAGEEPEQGTRCSGQRQVQGQAGPLPWRLVEALVAVGRLPGVLAAAGADQNLALQIKGLNSFGGKVREAGAAQAARDLWKERACRVKVERRVRCGVQTR